MNATNKLQLLYTTAPPFNSIILSIYISDIYIHKYDITHKYNIYNTHTIHIIYSICRSLCYFFFFQFVFVYEYKHIARAQHIACASTNPPHYLYCWAVAMKQHLVWWYIWVQRIYNSHIASLLNVYGAGGGVHKNSWYFAIIRTARDEPYAYIYTYGRRIYKVYYEQVYITIHVYYIEAPSTRTICCVVNKEEYVCNRYGIYVYENRERAWTDSFVWWF